MTTTRRLRRAFVAFGLVGAFVLTLTPLATATHATTTLVPAASCGDHEDTPSAQRGLASSRHPSVPMGSEVATSAPRRSECARSAGFLAAKAADEALPTITALTRQQDAALSAVMRDPNKLRHIFGKPQHNLGPLTKELGGQEALIREAVLAVPRGTTGAFEVTTRLGRYDLTVRGRVVNGVPRIGTVFVP